MSSYYIHTESEQKGPYTLEELKSAGINKNSLVWREGLTDWIKAEELPELKVLFILLPPPFIQKKPTIAGVEKANASSIEKKTGKKNYLSLWLPILILLIAGAFYFYSNGSKSKKSEIIKEKIASIKIDSLNKKDTSKADTLKKSNLDSLSNWIDSDSISKQKNDNSNETDFTMGGIPVHKSNDKAKKKVKRETTKQEVKAIDKKENIKTETAKQIPVKNLLIRGSFRKNLLLEAVLEGTIQNPNNKESFSNIIVTVQFLNADGQELGTKQFTQNSVIHGEESISFKFKTYAPKGTKAVKYAVAGNSS